MTDQRTLDREEWAEQEARQFEKNAEYLQECIAGWIKNGDKSGSDNFLKAYEIALKVQFYKDAARQLRHPHYMRLENESYQQ